mmetsp:Transcript_3024/g.6051  ORF Transcript_3024/g.6051 Transcript_3024/m.6051 type:complete len:463 (+) Transcript_3024:145-1533(+)
MPDDAEFMSGWDDPTIVTERLRQSLESMGVTTFPIISSTVEPLGGHSGLSGEMSLLTLTVRSADDDESKTDTLKFVLKRTLPAQEAKLHSKTLGLYREGTFYSTIGPWIQERLDKVPCKCASSRDNSNDSQPSNKISFIPKALFAASDAETSQKAIVLEYYQNSTEAGMFFPHSIHNAFRKCDTGNASPAINEKSISLEATRIAASIHGTFYRDRTLLENPEISSKLRVADWLRGLNKESFLASQQEVCDTWARSKEQWEKGEFYDGKVAMEPKFIDVMDASCKLALDFDAFVKKWNVDGEDDVGAKKIGWSLVHSDYHPGNLLCVDANNKDSNATPQLVLLDWEVVGVGSGPQDIGQFLISHMKTQDAVDMLDELSSVYRKSLIETLQSVNPSQVNSVPCVEDIKNEIVYGGLERWVWLNAYMSGWAGRMPPVYMQYFHDQMHGWIEKNGIAPGGVGMPRP